MKTLFKQSHFIQSDKISDLEKILEPEINLVSTSRNIDSIKFYLEKISELNEFKFSFTNENINFEIEKLPFSNHIQYSEFKNEILNLAKLYKKITNENKFFIQIESINKITCPKFHVDFTKVRMLCSYYGKGTEFLINESTNHYSLPISDEFINSSKIFSFETGSILLLKGESYSGNSGKGIIHRSPELLKNEKRILLRIDTLS